MDSRDHSISPPAKRARVAIEAAMTSAFKSMNGSNKKQKLIDARIQPVGGNSKKPPMHSGRWTMEEEQYVEGMIAEFKAGLLPISEGTTMRSFLAKMLNCNPKRVSKKYDGNPIYNGKLAYVRSTAPPPQAVACQRQENLLELERKFREALLTMQRVERRLKTITGQMALQEKEKETKSRKSVQQTTQEDNEPSISSDAALIAKVASVASSSHGKSGAPPISDYCPSSSAVSSLTNEEEDADRAMTMATSGRAEEMSIAQVSGGGSSRGKLKNKPSRVARNSLVVSSPGEQAATLSLMNASSPAGAPKPLEGASDDEKEATLTLLQLNSAKTDEELAPAGASQPTFHTAAVSVAPTSQCSGSSCNQNNDVNLQSLLQKLEGFRQHPGQQGLGPMNQAQLLNSVANAPVRSPVVAPTNNSGANLQEFLIHEAPRRRFDSPIQQPVQTRNSLQGLLHALQEKQQAPVLPNQMPANAQQQQGQTDSQGLLQMAQQPQPPVLQNPVKEAKDLLQKLIQASNQPPQAVPSCQQQAMAGGLDNISAEDLQNLLQQISNATNSATVPRDPPQPPVQQQQQGPPQDNDMANMLQGFLQAQQASQPACANNQRVINSPLSQQGGMQQQQQPQDGAMSILMDQLAQCVSNQPQQQQPQQGSSLNNQDFQQLLQSVAPSMNQMQQPQQQQRQPQQNFMQQGPSQPCNVPQVHAQQQVNPPIEQNCQMQVPDPESLQRFLIQLQQQSQGSK